jgi:fatty acid desaturase
MPLPGETDGFRHVRQQVTALGLSEPNGARSLVRALVISAPAIVTAVLAMSLGVTWMWLVHIAVTTLVLCTIPAVYHEGTHGNLARARLANNVVATTAAALHFVPFETWRLFHLAHHAHAGTDDDPEVYPDSWSRLSLLAFPVAYWTFVVLLWRWTFSAGRRSGPAWIRTPRQVRAVRVSAAAGLLIVGAMLVGTLSFWPELALLALVPMFLSVMLASLTLVPEHHPANRIGTPSVDQLDRTASFRPAGPLRFVMWNSNLHAAHHFAPGVPAHHLPAIDDMIEPLQAPEWRNRGYVGWYRRTFRDLPWRGPSDHDDGSGRS